jgi:protein-disulfide isomerase
MNTKHTQGLGTPTAILIVGILIAGAILLSGMSGSDSKPSNGNEAPQIAAVNPEAVEDLLKELDVDGKELAACVADEESAVLVQKDYEEGLAAGVRGTPYSLVVDTKTGVTIPVSGGQPFSNFKVLIDAILEDSPELSEASVESTISTDTANDYIRGNEDARILVIEYSDIECPYCETFHKTMKEALDVYPDDIQWAYRHFPLDQIHPNARKAAATVECIGQQKGADAFWTALDAMFADQSIPKSL